MTPQNFLAAVLPSAGNGYYCAAELTTRKKEHVYVKDIAELQPHIERWGAKDIYFALATFLEAGSREAVNAVMLKSVFIDMDGYESKKAAALALFAFLERTGLDTVGKPWIVASGGGIHCYWALLVDVPYDVWKVVAENFKRLCKQEGLAIDMTVTADGSRVLRVPGTFNHKKKYGTPREVKVLAVGDPIDFDEFARIINEKLAPTAAYKAKPTMQIEGTRAKRKPGASGVKLLQNSNTRFETIWLKTEAGNGCGQLKNYVDNATDDGMEPIWRGLLSWAQKCEDGPDYATWLSELHPYPAERMQQKLSEIKGPYACLKMDSENPGICGDCKHWGKITNPLALGRVVETSTEAREVVVDVQQPAQPDEADELDAKEQSSIDIELGLDAASDEHVHKQTLYIPPAPRGFSYGKKGGIYRSVTEKDADDKPITVNKQILAYDLFVVDVLRLEGDYVAHMLGLHPHGNLVLDLPMRSIGSKDEVIKLLGSKGVIASFGKGNDVHLFDYVRAAIEESSMTKRAIDVPTQFGWQNDNSFVYNNRVFTPNGKVTTLPMPGMENINRKTNSSGTIEDWRKPWHLFAARGMNTMLAIALDSFAAPLMRFTNEDGMVYHIASRYSGTGKSLTLSLKAGVWGHPKRYRTGKSSSPVAMQQRLGLLNSLPMVIDEITAKSRADFEWAPSFIFDVAEGQGKERMESGANKERLNNSTWQTTVTMTANESIMDYLAGARKNSSYGEMYRMLEWDMTEALSFTTEEEQIIKLLSRNYGLAGEMWVRYLVTHREEVAAMVQKVYDKLKERFGFTAVERYWHSACACTIAAGILLGPKYANIIALPMEGISQALRGMVDKARYAIRRNSQSEEDVLNTYIRDNYGKLLIIKKDGVKFVLMGSNPEGKAEKFTRDTVMGRIEHGTLQPGFVEVFIEEQLMKRHCVAMSFGYADFCKKMEARHKVTYVKKNMLAGTDGPIMKVNTIHISMDATAFNEVPVEPPEAG